MTLLAVILYSAAALAEASGVVLLISGMVRTRRALSQPAEVSIIDGNDPPPDYTVERSLDQVDRLVLHDRLHPWPTISLLMIGILLGTAGNLVTLDWSRWPN